MLRTLPIGLLALTVALGSSAFAQDADAEAAYTATISKRADDVIAALQPLDSEHSARVHAVLVRQYRTLRDLHDRRDADLKAVDKADRNAVEAVKRKYDFNAQQNRHEFYTALAAELSPEQVDIVKDKLTYNKVAVTYNGYLNMLPDLTAAQKEKIRAELLSAREQAVFGGSAEEKTLFFEKAKGRINNYLSSEGYDLKQASKDWAERRKAAATQPSN